MIKKEVDKELDSNPVTQHDSELALCEQAPQAEMRVLQKLLQPKLEVLYTEQQE